MSGGIGGLDSDCSKYRATQELFDQFELTFNQQQKVTETSDPKRVGKTIVTRERREEEWSRSTFMLVDGSSTTTTYSRKVTLNDGHTYVAQIGRVAKIVANPWQSMEFFVKLFDAKGQELTKVKRSTCGGNLFGDASDLLDLRLLKGALTATLEIDVSVCAKKRERFFSTTKDVVTGEDCR